MRPRVFAAEDRPVRGQRLWSVRASMRPRVFAAEDVLRSVARALMTCELQ